MKKLLFALMYSFQLLAIEPDPIPERLPTEKERILFQKILEKRTQSYTYASLGTTGSLWSRYSRGILGAEPFIGRRSFLSSHLAVDFGGGVFIGKKALFYTQGSLLYYPTPFRGPYLGAGVTLGALVRFDGYTSWPWINTPLTFGYQFRTEDGHSPFVQIQITPTPVAPHVTSGTISFGWDLY